MASYYIGLYTVRRYYAEKQQQQQQKQKHSQFPFCVLTVSAEAAIRKF